ncbi:MAG: hypothetical protein PHN31_00820 [Candidatus Gracilibacteria bacterium]|nr:hypothetical protein [Candidatus Gracilibacteria bacterium]
MNELNQNTEIETTHIGNLTNFENKKFFISRNTIIYCVKKPSKKDFTYLKLDTGTQIKIGQYFNNHDVYEVFINDNKVYLDRETVLRLQIITENEINSLVSQILKDKFGKKCSINSKDKVLYTNNNIINKLIEIDFEDIKSILDWIGNNAAELEKINDTNEIKYILNLFKKNGYTSSYSTQNLINEDKIYYDGIGIIKLFLYSFEHEKNYMKNIYTLINKWKKNNFNKQKAK